MKFILPLLLLLLSVGHELNAQCQVQNGGFEMWTDYTDSFEHELGLELTEPVIFPTNWFSIFRLTQIALSGFIIDYLDQDSLDIPIFNTLQQYSPGANGTATAAKISGDSLELISDLVQFAECSFRPEKMTGYFKYEGEGQDTLRIAAILYKGNELVDTADAIGYANFSVVGTPIDISRDAADFTAFSADFIYNSDENPDTVAILILSTKDEANPNDTSFHVVDEIQFEGGVVPTKDYYQEAPYALTPNPATELLTLNLNSRYPIRVELYDAIGNRVLDKDVSSSESISIRHLPSGTYLSRIRSAEDIFWQKLVINR
ncbi:MAG: T9SS type A sorting domain-containing protein [Saprospiraceae bacterium]|nr:T9SS type A sorting domain-containing protein [Saprospiraceae bacterium]